MRSLSEDKNQSRDTILSTSESESMCAVDQLTRGMNRAVTQMNGRMSSIKKRTENRMAANMESTQDSWKEKKATTSRKKRK